MSELNILTLHIEKLNMKVMLIHDVPKEDIQTLIESLEQKAERKCK